MKVNQVKEYLSELINKQLMGFLAAVLKERRCDEGLESAYLHAHWCIAEASRMKSDDSDSWEPWEVELLALHDPKEYGEEWHDKSPSVRLAVAANVVQN